MSFFDKLKGGIGIDTPEKEPANSSSVGRAEKKEKSKPKPKPEKPVVSPKEEPQPEGQLAIDVYETNGNLVVQSTIAGIKSEDLDITIENDLVTIRGKRNQPTEAENRNYFYQECYWGSFSRQVILPEEVDGSKAEAKMKDGVLTLTIPKIQRKKKKKIIVKQEE